MKLNLEVTPVFERNYDAVEQGYRFIINQGGSRSSKSISILQLIIKLAVEKKRIISICRSSFPSLKATTIRDLLELLNSYNLYFESQHNKTDNYYEFRNGSMIEWFSLDDSQKVRGRKRDVLFIDETNEVDYETFLQLNMRTSTLCLFAYNPSEHNHWCYELINNEKAILIKSTYKDNHFLPQSQVEEIEDLINADYNYYRIYCLGEAPTNDSLIYSHFKQVSFIPEDLDSPFYGLDFGFNDPCALVKCFHDKDNNAVYTKELLFKSKLTSDDLINEMVRFNIGRAPVYYDSARPEIAESMKRAGFNMKPCDKRSIKGGIDTVKKHKIFYTSECLNIKNEVGKYRWKTDKAGNVLDEPLDKDNHILDAVRYAVHTHLNKRSVTDIYLDYLLKRAA